MLKLICALLLFLFVFKLNANRKGGVNNPSSLLIGVYLLSAIISIPHMMINSGFVNSNIALISLAKYWVGLIYLLFALLLFLFPFFFFKENAIQEIFIPKPKIINAFSIIIVCLSLFSIAYYIPSIVSLFRSGIALSVLRDNITLREDYIHNSGILNTIASVSSSMYPFAILLFYLLFIKGNQPVLCALLFFSSFSNVFHVLTFVGRDGIVFWLLSFLSIHFFFEHYLNNRQINRINRIIIISALLSLLPFMAISISRFGKGYDDNGTIKSFISYLGQMIPNFLLFYDVKDSHINYGVSFPLFWEVIGTTPPINKRWIDGGTESNVFGTFIKGFVTNFGALGTILIGLIYNLFFISVFNPKRTKISFHHFFVYILFFKIISEGVFYFRDYTRGGNLFIILCIVLYLIFSYIDFYFGSERLLINNELLPSKNRIRIRIAL